MPKQFFNAYNNENSVVLDNPEAVLSQRTIKQNGFLYREWANNLVLKGKG